MEFVEQNSKKSKKLKADKTKKVDEKSEKYQGQSKKKRVTKKALLEQKLNEVKSEAYEKLAETGDVDDPENVLKNDHWLPN